MSKQKGLGSNMYQRTIDGIVAESDNTINDLGFYELKIDKYENIGADLMTPKRLRVGYVSKQSFLQDFASYCKRFKEDKQGFGKIVITASEMGHYKDSRGALRDKEIRRIAFEVIV